MKALFILILSIFFAFFIACSDIFTPAGGDVEPNNVVPDTNWFWRCVAGECIISTPEELAGLSLLVRRGRNMAGKVIVLGSDISFNTRNRSANSAKFRWTPIGINEDTSFSGVFDGRGHIVSGIYLYSANNHQGFFGWIDGGAVVRNVGLENLHIDGSGRHIGGLVGTNRLSSIQNSFTKGTVSGNFNYTGGLVGYNCGGRIENSFSHARVSGDSDVGGLVGANLGLPSSIVNSYSFGQASGNKNVGGLVGHNAGATIANSYFNREASQRNDEENGIGKTASEMRQDSTFVGWDFANTWRIGNNYPELRIFFPE